MRECTVLPWRLGAISPGKSLTQASKPLAAALATWLDSATQKPCFNFLPCLLVSVSSTMLVSISSTFHACLLVLVALMHFAYLLLVYMHACLVHLHVFLINNTRSLYCLSIKFVSHVLHVCA